MEAMFSRRTIQLFTILCFILLRHLNSVTFKVNGPAQHILTLEGKDVLLSCHISPKMDIQNMTIKWFQDQTLVHRYHIWKKVEETQGPEFQGRTELMKHDLAEGKATLKIYKVRCSDSGNYTCHFRSPDYYNEAHFRLQVSETPPHWKTSYLSLKIVLYIAIWIIVPFSGLVFIIWAFIVCKKHRGNLYWWVLKRGRVLSPVCCRVYPEVL